MSESQKTVGAINLYVDSKGTWPSNIKDLPHSAKSVYLDSIPAGSSQVIYTWALKSEAGQPTSLGTKKNFIIRPVSSENVCVQINMNLNNKNPKEIPACNSITSGSYCCHF